MVTTSSLPPAKLIIIFQTIAIIGAFSSLVLRQLTPVLCLDKNVKSSLQCLYK